MSGVVTPCGEIVSGVKTGGRALGPRYISFMKGDGPYCYVVNELSSQVAVFEYHPEVAAEIGDTCLAFSHSSLSFSLIFPRFSLVSLSSLSFLSCLTGRAMANAETHEAKAAAMAGKLLFDACSSNFHSMLLAGVLRDSL